MKCITIVFCTAVLAFTACNNDKTASETTTTDAADSSKPTENKTADAAPMPDSATMQKNWMEYMTPGAVHTMMASWNGTWTAAVSMWWTPDGPPTTSTATTVNKMALGGRYQVSNHKGTYNDMPFEGMSTLAYDNVKKVFESIWIDNMGTGIMHMQGPWDEATKSITLTGKMIDATTGKETTAKEIFRIIDDNNHVMEMYAPAPDGKEFKTMEIKYTRKK